MAGWLEHQTLNRENPGSNPLTAIFEFGQFFSLHIVTDHWAA